MAKPIAITLGDPAGVGPEVVLKTVLTTPQPKHPWILIGSLWSLQRSAGALGLPMPDIDEINSIAEATAPVSLLQPGACPAPADFAFGKVQVACGELAVRSVEFAARACLAGEVSAMVTAPIHKEAIHAAGYVDDIGHQEILARLAGVNQTATMLMTPGLKVVHLSTHKSLADAVKFVRRDTVLDKLQLMHDTLTRWGMQQSRIALAALNPHGGEGGLLGKEEAQELQPAVAAAVELGIDVTGPVPADSVFNRAIGGEFDVVLALYHDQGHIAIKVHNFHQSTTATLGIPFVRTSVDHGTAFDIAGKGQADPTGLAAAVDAAEAIVDGRLS
ncbi:MAG: 4-hydroxythreonine-4-phosphate dehydrogenase PdxA [Pseudomonadota bacterium]|nr:4-hydroxythreonine-4-phosphate dehydrogenase PdxA [Pseudomonadota bacterium]